MSAGELERALAAAGLPGEPRHPLPADAHDAEVWAQLLGAAQRARMLGLLDQLVAAGTVVTTDAQATKLESLATQVGRSCALLDHLLIDVARRFTAESVDFRVLKGPVIAHLDESDPMARQYSDVDVLIHGDDLEPAVSALGPIGFDRDLPERRPGFDRRFGKEIPMVRQADGIDIHRVLALGAFGLAMPLPALWHDRDVLPLAGTELPALGLSGRFVHACITVELGDQTPRLTAMRDVAVLSWRPLEVDAVLALAPPGRGLGVVSAAVHRCREQLGDVVGPSGLEIADRTEPSAWERRALRTYRSHGGSNTSELLGGLLALRGTRDRAAYLRGLVAPSPTYRSSRRAAGRPREWRTGLLELRRARRSGP